MPAQRDRTLPARANRKRRAAERHRATAERYELDAAALEAEWRRQLLRDEMAS